MNTESALAMIIDGSGAAWFTFAIYQWPRAWNAALAGQLGPAAKLAAITAQSLLVSAMLTWPNYRNPGKHSVSIEFGEFLGQAGLRRIGMLFALLMLLTALVVTLAVGVRSRAKEKEFSA